MTLQLFEALARSKFRALTDGEVNMITDTIMMWIVKKLNG